MNTGPLYTNGDARGQSAVPPTQSLLILLGLAVCLAALVYQIHLYWFMSDDSFIAFRYARNLSRGEGLVFNPGGERVEGYTSFLWVVLLALLDRLGAAPDLAANWIAAPLGVALWALTIFFCWRAIPPARHRWLILVPAAWLAFNRSYAVWSSGGLETKLYEILTISGVLLSIRESERENGRWAPPAFLLAMASLTRPDGILISICVMSARVLWEWRRGRLNVRRAAVGGVVYLAIVGAHFAFRRLYYGEWLPNTYYAKLDATSWWDLGLTYLGAFALEYLAIIWLPLAAFGAMGLIRERHAAVPLLIGAAILPHALYVAYAGGDNFEFRPLNLYLPLLAILIYAGARDLSETKRSPLASAIWSSAACLLPAFIPALTHLDFPEGYRSGFPGSSVRLDGTQDLISAKLHPNLFSVPGLGGYLRLYNKAYATITSHYGGLREEEQRMHLATVVPEGKILARMVSEELLPADTYLATRCVGAIPYLSGLRTLDMLGLTDAHVAHGPMAPNEGRFLAHGKQASADYIASRGVDVSALVVNFTTRDPAVLESCRETARRLNQGKMNSPIYISKPFFDGTFFYGLFYGTPDEIQRRFPNLGLEPAWK